ncbi:MAG TPA: ferritin-like domain-containing protein [Gemmatimonadales bacterium]|nr:ferritin-like domain-containing protein [Gemmatimonadales bacterium]
MKAKTILGSLDADLTAQVVSRRGALAKSGKMAGALALASMPVAFGLMAKSAFAQAGGLPQGIIDVLNFALTLEYLEDEFYRSGLNAGVIPADALPIFQTISAHEAAHVALLTGAISSGGGTPATKPNFDFTAGGTFPNPFTDYPTFQALSQGFEDTGVRAYKGQATALMANDDILTTALQIHSVEARHASAVRRLRGQKGWITGNQSGIASAAVQPIYNGEENTTQGVPGIDTAQFGTADSASEAFDEPLTKDQVLAIATPFIVA